jgi:2-haloacid dehalogenase
MSDHHVETASVPKAVLFDAYGTLFDVHSLTEAAEQLFPGRGHKLVLLWRDKQLEYSRLLTMSNRYASFWDLTCNALRYSILRFELPVDPASEAQLLAQYRTLKPFPENRAVLVHLKQRGIKAGILSNGDPPMLEAAVQSAGFTDLLSPVLSVDTVRRFKTDPTAYALGPKALGLPARDILFVSSNCWDAVGATWYGYTTLWINRGGVPLEQLGVEPTRTGASLREVLSFFISDPERP